MTKTEGTGLPLHPDCEQREQIFRNKSPDSEQEDLVQ